MINNEYFEEYQLTHPQKRIWYTQKIYENETMYNIGGYSIIKGDVSFHLLEEAMNIMIKSNDAFRLQFIEQYGDVVQYVEKFERINIDFFDFSMYEEPHRKCNEWIDQEFKREFLLEKSSLYYIAFFKINDKENGYFVKMHHIISDGWSFYIMSDIIRNTYSKLKHGEVIEKTGENSYLDFIKTEQIYLNSNRYLRDKKFWNERFSNISEFIEINTDNIQGKRKKYVINRKKSQQIRSFALKHRISLNTFFTSIMLIYLSKVSCKNDNTIGIPILNRSGSKEKKIIGMFTSTMPFRYIIDDKCLVEDFIVNVNRVLLRNLAHQKYPYDLLVKDLELNKKGSDGLFNIIVNYYNTHLISEFDGMPSESIELYSGSQDYSLQLIVKEWIKNGELTLAFDYKVSEYSEEQIEHIYKQLDRIIEQILEKPKEQIENLEILTLEEKYKILYEFNNTKTEYPRSKSISELFGEIVEIYGENIALVSNEQSITYKELNERANKIAHILREKGVTRDTIVPILCDRSIETIVGIVGIVKSGGAYLPIDEDYPESRIRYIIKDSECRIIIDNKKLLYKYKLNKINVELISFEDKEISDMRIENLKNINIPEDLLYVMYTSGSTGQPKGIGVMQKNVVRLVKNTNFIEFKEKDRILQTGSIAFDASTFEIWGALINGLQLHIESKEIILNGDALGKYLKENKITICWITSPLFNQLCKDNLNIFETLRCLLTGGDVVSQTNISKLKEANKNLVIIDGYGPTENTTFSTTYTIDSQWDDKRAIPIGKPIANSTAYIMDKNHKLLPIGISGELCVGGDGVARGYLKREELTNEKFVENPYVKGEIIYKTGDLGRWLPDGNIEFLGRKDFQVKIRGFRIELGEIESTILSYEQVEEVCTIVREEEEKYICTYYVGKDIEPIELKKYLLDKLPLYMVPSFIIKLEKMPLTPNGKIDRKALPKPHVTTGQELIPSSNEIEERLMDIWKEILNIDSVGVEDNFFELGGHSLKATMLTSKIHKELNVEIKLKQIFKYPSIKAISQYIESAEKEQYESIRPADQKEYYEVSSSQKRIYMLQQFDLKSTVYNMPGIMLVEGNLDRRKLENIFKKIIQRHETFRTSFNTVGEKIVQVIQKETDFKIEYIESVNKTIKEIEKEFVKPFDLRKSPLLRVTLIKLNGLKHIMLFDMHHIISDGTSIGILKKEISMLYEGKELSELKIQYKDYSEWQKNISNDRLAIKQKKYWDDVLCGELPILNIPTDYVRPSVQSYEGDCIDFKFDKELTKELRKIANETETTMHMILLSGLNILLSKYSGQEDIIIGCTVAGRQHADLEKIIGAFINTLPMRNYPQGNKTYEEFLEEVKKNSLNSYENQEYQFEELTIRKDMSRNPLFDVVLILQNMNIGEIKLNDLTITEGLQENKIAKVDLTFNAIENKEEILLSVEYCTKLYKKETIKKMIEHYKNIFKVITNNIKIKLNEIRIISKNEREKLLYKFNNTYLNININKTLHELFEEQVKKTPNNIALVFENEKVTYKELNERSNGLARTLRKKGIKRNDIVGIVVERSIELIVGIFAIIKSGGAYLPIDPNYPEDRIQYMLDNSGSIVVLTQQHILNKMNFKNDTINVNATESYNDDKSNLENNNLASDLVYIIYTSGTTGKPKGVMIEHKNLINATCAWKIHYKLDKYQVKLLQMASMAFDVFTGDICRSLLNGGTMYICSNNVKLNMKALYEVLTTNRINIFESTPSLIIMFMNYVHENNLEMKYLKLLILGSDVCATKEYIKLVEKYGNNMRIINSYGITEATIDSSYYEEKLENIPYTVNTPIGRPLHNTKFYILNNALQLQPIGVYGELYVGGYGLARGYFNLPELTKHKFIQNPFEEGEKIYKTGDLARWLPDGNVEFLGRIDHQVKIRGFRVEIEEIQNYLLNHESINEAIVIDKEDKDGCKYLCTYISLNNEVSIREIKEYLLKSLPYYMIPSYFVQIDKIPLSPNGKIDRKALPEPEISSDVVSEYEAPRNELEEKLVAIWKEILGIEKIGINDNFFDIGGHSLKAAVLASKTHNIFNVELTINEIFKLQTIRGISKYIRKAKIEGYEPIKQIKEKEYYETSAAQRRMYMLQQLDSNATVYNIAQALFIEGKLNIDRVEKVFNSLLGRHESLRTFFGIIGEKIIQKTQEEVEFKVEYIDKGKQNINKIVKDFVKPFYLNQLPLLRVCIVRVEEEKYILLIDMHHIISDGVSVGILINEFVKLYEGNKLDKLKIQYKDYAEWHNNLLSSDKIKQQKEYWLERFQGDIPILSLPYDYVRPEELSFEGEHVDFIIDIDVTSKLHDLAKDSDCTLYMVLLSIFNIVLSKYSSQQDIIVGSPTAGRPHIDLHNVIGVFVNTLVMRNYPQSNKSYIEFLKEVKENSLQAYDNSDYPFDMLVENLGIKRNITRNPLFDVMFTMQNTGYTYEDIKINDIKCSPYDLKHNVSKFDLLLTVIESDKVLKANFEYNTKLFKKDTVLNFINSFKFVISKVLNDKQIKLSNISLISEKKIKDGNYTREEQKNKIRDQLQLEFNFK